MSQAEEILKKIPEEHRKVLSWIQEKANKKFSKRLFKHEDNKEILFVFDKMLEKDLPEWKQKFYKAMRKDYEGQKTVVDEDVAKEMDEYVKKEIQKAIKDGKLPANSE